MWLVCGLYEYVLQPGMQCVMVSPLGARDVAARMPGPAGGRGCSCSNTKLMIHTSQARRQTRSRCQLLEARGEGGGGGGGGEDGRAQKKVGKQNDKESEKETRNKLVSVVGELLFKSGNKNKQKKRKKEKGERRAIDARR